MWRWDLRSVNCELPEIVNVWMFDGVVAALSRGRCCNSVLSVVVGYVRRLRRDVSLDVARLTMVWGRLWCVYDMFSEHMSEMHCRALAGLFRRLCDLAIKTVLTVWWNRLFVGSEFDEKAIWWFVEGGCKQRPDRHVVVVSYVSVTYLVDPASSYMLVSKIKPCTCKYTPF